MSGYVMLPAYRQSDKEGEAPPNPVRYGQAGSMPGEVIEAHCLNEVDSVRYRIDIEVQLLSSNENGLKLTGRYRGNGCLDGRRCIIKIFHGDEETSNTRLDMSLQISQLVNDAAYEFIQYAKYRRMKIKPIRFTEPKIATVTRMPFGINFTRPGARILVEEFIEGNYEKFNSSTGWHTDDEIDVLQAFCHFTFHNSDGQLLVCNIEGVRTSQSYTLANPTVHSRTQGAYGPTDLGPAGMSWFLTSHGCSNICAKLQLPQPVFNANKGISKGRFDSKASSYVSMLSVADVEVNADYRTRTDLPAVRADKEVEQGKGFWNAVWKVGAAGFGVGAIVGFCVNFLKR